MDEMKKLGLLFGYFALLGILYYYVELGQAAWLILLASAIAWFVLEARGRRRGIGDALKVGAFLLAFDFIFENAGWVLGLWATKSGFAIGVVPLEVMGIAFFGGAAWALYLPGKFGWAHSLADCLVFAFFGALGEWLLIRQGLFEYYGWWTSILAFFAYLGTWAMLHLLRYRAFGGKLD